MRVVHHGETERTLATEIEVADSFLGKVRGLMFRQSIESDAAMVFPFDRATRRSLHMLFVPFPIDAVWVRDGTVTQCKRLRPWTGLGWAVADTIYELPAGAAAGVEPGDGLSLES